MDKEHKVIENIMVFYKPDHGLNWIDESFKQYIEIFVHPSGVYASLKFYDESDPPNYQDGHEILTFGDTEEEAIRKLTAVLADYLTEPQW